MYNVPWTTACFGIKELENYTYLYSHMVTYFIPQTQLPYLVFFTVHCYLIYILAVCICVCTVYTIAVVHTGIAVYNLRQFVNHLALELNAQNDVQTRTEIRST